MAMEMMMAGGEVASLLVLVLNIVRRNGSRFGIAAVRVVVVPVVSRGDLGMCMSRGKSGL